MFEVQISGQVMFLSQDCMFEVQISGQVMPDVQWNSSAVELSTGSLDLSLYTLLRFYHEMTQINTVGGVIWRGGYIVNAAK